MARLSRLAAAFFRGVADFFERDPLGASLSAAMVVLTAPLFIAGITSGHAGLAVAVTVMMVLLILICYGLYAEVKKGG